MKTCRTEKITDDEWVALREKDKLEKILMEEMEDLEDMGRSTILLCHANNNLREVLSLLHPVDIWDKFKSQYKLKSLTSRLYLTERLVGLQMMEEADFNQHLDKFNKVTTELDSLEVKIEEEDKALLLLASSPSYFDNIMTILLFGKETLRPDKVVAAFLMNKA